MEKVDVLIIGSGPAGYTAAIYTARAGLSPVLYEGIQPGGQLTITTDVENYPGFPNGIQGPEMMMHFKNQALRFGTDIRNGNVVAVDFSHWPHKIKIENEEELEAKAVIIATGASAKWLGLESEKKLNGKGVSACAVCDGFFFRGQDVAVVGGGDTAAEEASYLSKLAKKVYLIVRRNELRASTFMQNRLTAIDNIEILWNTETVEILGDEEVTGVKIINTVTQKIATLSIQGFFVAIGHQPNTEIFKDYLERDTNGYILTQPNSTHTRIQGVFATGDAQDKIYRQAVTAAGSGCMGALDAERFLAKKESEK